MIQRLLSESAFAPESVAVLTMAFEAAVRELNIQPSDESARLHLARLVIQIGGEDPEMSPEDLTDKVTAAWEWRAKARPPGRGPAGR